MGVFQGQHLNFSALQTTFQINNGELLETVPNATQNLFTYHKMATMQLNSLEKNSSTLSFVLKEKHNYN